MDELVYYDSALIALLKQYHRTRRLKPSAGQVEIMMPRQHPFCEQKHEAGNDIKI